MPAPEADRRHQAAWYERDSRFIPAHWQPAALIDLLEMRDLDVERLLPGTRLFREDARSGGSLVSPQQYGQLLANAARLVPDRDLPFLYGQRLFPGHYGAFSLLLLNAPHLFDAITSLTDYSLQLSPLWQPRARLTRHFCEICWEPAFDMRPTARFALESVVGGWIAFCRWLCPEPLPWRLELTHAEPPHVELYDVHLKSELRFRQPINRLIIPRDVLYLPWPRASATAHALARESCVRETASQPRRAFLSAVRTYLERNLRQPPSLQSAADDFGMSTATFKRRLRKHGISFQVLLDRVRTETAMQLLTEAGMNAEQVARHLRYHDANNFRRSFKRWTGYTPSAAREIFCSASRSDTGKA